MITATRTLVNGTVEKKANGLLCAVVIDGARVTLRSNGSTMTDSGQNIGWYDGNDGNTYEYEYAAGALYLQSYARTEDTPAVLPPFVMDHTPGSTWTQAGQDAFDANPANAALIDGITAEEALDILITPHWSASRYAAFEGPHDVPVKARFDMTDELYQDIIDAISEELEAEEARTYLCSSCGHTVPEDAVCDCTVKVEFSYPVRQALSFLHDAETRQDWDEARFCACRLYHALYLAENEPLRPLHADVYIGGGRTARHFYELNGSQRAACFPGPVEFTEAETAVYGRNRALIRTA